jgi:GNAT superfamily N-acetyltransferase
MLIRSAGSNDAEALAALHLDVWDEAYADLVPPRILAARRASPNACIELWRAILAHPTSTTLVAEDDGELVGFISAGPGRDEPHEALPGLELKALYVRAQAYGAGVGHRLFQAAVGEAPAYLWVLAGNERAIAFYRRQGFSFDGSTRTDEVGTELRMTRG